MKAVIEKVNAPANYSFSTEVIELPYFISSWHFHNEYEINLVTQGTGTLFTGDSIRKFGPGTLVLIGGGLPHVLLNDKEHYNQNNRLMAASVVIKFDRNCLGNGFFEKPELFRIKQLLDHASRGILFDEIQSQDLAQQIKEMPAKEDFERIIAFLEILNSMANVKNPVYLSSDGFVNKVDYDGCERIDKVYKYVLKNFSKPIKLEEVAEIAHLSTTAFCRYFKSRTLKTFSRFLNEIRIGYACKLLIEDRLSISEICYQTGFNYLSNFHKQFRNIMKLTPQQYQTQFRGQAKGEGRGEEG